MGGRDATGTPSPPNALVLRPGDDVAVAVRPITRGEKLGAPGIAVHAAEEIPRGHKAALRAIRRDEPIRKLGEVIGFATREIAAGAHVHEHNCEARPFARARREAPGPPGPPRAAAGRTFLGYRREDGAAGTRNYVAAIATVACAASVAREIARRANAEILPSHPGADGVFVVAHDSGCGIPEGGPDHERLERTLAGFATHPNVAGSLLVGLGCEVAQPAKILARAGAANPRLGSGRIRSASIQELGGSAKTVEAGLRIAAELLARASAERREAIPLARLVLALQCGGSDGYSAITANPALGAACDALVAAGGTVVLAETPEVYGAEHLLAARAVSDEVAEALFERVRWWEEHVTRFGASIDNNPSPGNKAGGITTIYEKSLGAVAKAGSSPLVAVYGYAERVRSSGLVFMDTPGYDPVSLTGLAAGGATVAAFTTGRGSVYALKPVPAVKIATTTELFERMGGDLDVDAGVILRGVPIETVGERIFERILAVASGEKAKGETCALGGQEFAPWLFGPTL